jgi:hypothetical protein
METLPEVVREMIAPSVQALAELSARNAVLEREISVLARLTAFSWKTMELTASRRYT